MKKQTVHEFVKKKKTVLYESTEPHSWPAACLLRDKQQIVATQVFGKVNSIHVKEQVLALRELCKWW